MRGVSRMTMGAVDDMVDEWLLLVFGWIIVLGVWYCLVSANAIGGVIN